MKNKEPFCVLFGEEIIVCVFNNEIDELKNYAEDAGHSLWYIMGTDAWFELEKVEEKIALVAKNDEKSYLTCFINDEIFQKIKEHEEYGIIVLSSAVEFNPEDLTNNLGTDLTKDDLVRWIEEKSKNHDMNLNALIFAYYTKERKLYYRDYFEN